MSVSDAGLNAPHLIDIEVAHALRRLAAKGDITGERGREMLAILAAMPIRRHAHVGFLGRIWELRANVTAYDAVYVAPAQVLDASLLTRDRRLAQAVGHLVPIEPV